MNHQQIESVLPSFTGLKIIDSRILLTAQLRLKSGILNLHIVNLICSPWSPSQNYRISSHKYIQSLWNIDWNSLFISLKHVFMIFQFPPKTIIILVRNLLYSTPDQCFKSPHFNAFPSEYKFSSFCFKNLICN